MIAAVLPTAAAVLVSLRPAQWVKNLVVLLVPVTAGVLLAPGVLARSLAALLAACLISSAGYLLNDVRDRAFDSRDAAKSARPVASGALPAPHALAAAAVLVVTALMVAVPAGVAPFVAGYALLAAAYCLGVKDVPGLELLVIATLFVLRLLTGAAAAGVPAPGWLVAATAAGALMLASGKRLAEVARFRSQAADGAGAGVPARRCVSGYRPAALDGVCSLAAAMLVIAYASWALSEPAGAVLGLAAPVSFALVVVAAARCRVLVSRGAGEYPLRMLGDRVVLASAAACAAVLLAGSLTAGG